MLLFEGLLERFRHLDHRKPVSGVFGYLFGVIYGFLLGLLLCQVLVHEDRGFNGVGSLVTCRMVADFKELS